MSAEAAERELTAATDDPYPSRKKGAAEFLDRDDPIVYGTRHDGPLSQNQLANFERDGFLILRDFFPPQAVESCRSELASLCASDEVKNRDESIVEPDNSELRSLFAVHRREISPLFSQVAADERVVRMANQILGDDVYIHQSRVNLKPGFAGKEFYWHSDFETWHVEDGMPRMRAISCSILLTPNDEHNGPLMLIPKSHRHYVTCVGETPDDHFRVSLKRQEYGVPDHESLTRLASEGGITSVKGAAGTVVLFDCNTMHGSNGNITPFPRSNLFFVFNSCNNRLLAPYCGKKPRPEYIAARAAQSTVKPREVTYSPRRETVLHS